MVIGKNAEPLPVGDKPLFSFEGEGIDTVEISLADTDGKLMKVEQKQADNSKPAKYALYQNYPNPFNPETQIKYSVSGDGMIHVSLKVYNVVGQLVKTLVDEEQMPGEYNRTWNGKDEKNQDVASGMYFYKLKISDFSETKKMVLLR
jgi:flagellar hook assembly protein FlgD